MPAESTSIESIVQNATPTPIFFDEDEEEYLPFHKPPRNIPTLQEPVVVPETIPRRSNRIAEKPPDPKPSHWDKAIQDSKEAATRVKVGRGQRKKMLQELWEEEKRNAPTVVEEAAIEELCQAFRTLNLRDEKVEQVDQVLSAISEMTKIDLSTLEFKDEPKMWEEAKHSADAKWWEEGYTDELTSLKEMGIYKLIPWCDIPQGTKIRKVRPVFKIKWDENGKAIRWKVHLVFKGFEQIYCKDYTKTTSPTARMES